MITTTCNGDVRHGGNDQSYVVDQFRCLVPTGSQPSRCCHLEQAHRLTLGSAYSQVRSAFMHAHSLLTSEGAAGQGLLERIVRMDKILLKRKVAAPAPARTPELPTHGGVSAPQGAYEADLDAVAARPSGGVKRARSDEDGWWAPSVSPKEAKVGKKRQKVEAEEEGKEGKAARKTQ